MEKRYRNKKWFTSQIIIETTGSLCRTADVGFDSEEDLLAQMYGKVVLDMGSGSGNFAKEAYFHLGDKTTVISMNPRLFLPYFDPIHDEDKVYFLTSIDLKGERPEDVAYAEGRYLQTRIAAEWEKLPFADESFDFIFIVGSFIYYPETYSDELLGSFIQLLRQQGELRIELSSNSTADDVMRAKSIAISKGCEVISKKEYLIFRRT